MTRQLIVVAVIFTLTSGEKHHVDLRNRGLRAVPTNILSATKSLDLSENLLKTIPNDSFINLSSLTSLDLSRNQLERLEPSAFRGLSQLASLRLSKNNLLLTYNSYPPSVFRPLKMLEILTLEKNLRNQYLQLDKYPDEIFSDLSSLKKLKMDGLAHVPFGSSFIHLSSLKSLYVIYNNVQATLNASTFAVFTDMPIESLGVECISMEPGTLKHFPFLTTLHMQTYGLRKAFSALVDLRGRNLTSLSIINSNSNRRGRTNAEDLIVTAEITAHLATMCVKHLDLSGNKIIKIFGEVLLDFKYPECVETFVINPNLMGIASNIFDVFGLFRFINLKYLDISGQKSVMRKKRNVLSAFGGFGYEFSTHTQRSETLRINLPPSVEWIKAKYMRGSNHKMANIEFVNARNLRLLDVAYAGIQYCGFIVSGLENLTQFNMSGFDCRVLSPNFFESFSSLEILSAKDCRLNIGFQNDSNGIIFRPLRHLRQLDLSNNDLTTLHPNLFQTLVALETLILSNNKLIRIPEAVLQMHSLKELDVTFNVISSLSSKETNRFTSLDYDKPFCLSLGNNPILCTCTTLTFIHWILETSVNITDNSSLACSLKNGTVVNILSYKSQIKNMDVSCVSKFWLTFSVVGSCLFTLAVVLGIFGYRYRWNIKYWILTKCRRGPVYEEVDMEQYQFDAFVAYNYHNYQWACIVLRNVLETENNYTLCLHDRDFPVGVSIQQNIVDAVNNSRKVILVISRAFLTSDWCEFEIQMASMRMVRDGRDNAIIVIMMEEIPVAEMPRSLLNLWTNITFLLWDSGQTDHRVFWDRLLEVMARP